MVHLRYAFFMTSMLTGSLGEVVNHTIGTLEFRSRRDGQASVGVTPALSRHWCCNFAAVLSRLRRECGDETSRILISSTEVTNRFGVPPQRVQSHLVY